MEDTIANYALVLDFDGVITRLNIDWQKLREELSRYLGIRVVSINKLFEETHGTQTFWLAHEFVERHELEAVKTSELNDEIKKLITTFPGTKYIATLQSEKAVIRFLERHKLLSIFREVLGRPRFASKEQELKYIVNIVSTNRVIFVDDSRQNIETCERLGIKYCIHVRNYPEVKHVIKLLKEISHTYW
ncbi:HAD hydrolase-like protein [Vulcanisaeta sp. JCM 16159]|uniref:HAD hydrolase-like protein n=1 Tax=Vulcanisaeta sp. JCM 16159 TaxID=1295371 RepID=UPI0006CF2A58|nr:HAD hydrolase-like protein [Vulcanisaeta sp. JCM 16159]